MTAPAVISVITQGPENNAQFRVLLAFAFTSDKNRCSAVGIEKIASLARCSIGHAQRVVTQLIDEGWVEKSEGTAPGRNAEYRIVR